MAAVGTLEFHGANASCLITGSNLLKPKYECYILKSASTISTEAIFVTQHQGTTITTYDPSITCEILLIKIDQMFGLEPPSEPSYLRWLGAFSLSSVFFELAS